MGAISGAVDIALATKGGTHRERMAKEVAAEAKTDLAQCPIEDCWDKNSQMTREYGGIVQKLKYQSAKGNEDLSHCGRELSKENQSQLK